jgi:hypothetical protein
MTAFGWVEAAGGDSCGTSSAGGVERLAAGGLLLKVAHSNVAVQAGSVLDL